MVDFRQDWMTDEERMNALLNYRKPDSVLIIATASGFYMVNCGYTLTELQTDQQKAFNAMHWTCEQYNWQPIREHPAHTVLGNRDLGTNMENVQKPT